MEKNFQKWHRKKAEINEKGKRTYFREKEIWFCYLGANVGSEQDGKGKDFLRPVIIIRKFNLEIFWGIPLTGSKNKEGSYYFTFLFKEKPSTAILSQIKLIDVRRLSYKIGEISGNDFAKLKEKLKALLP